MESALIKVLIVVTSTASMGSTDESTGFWLSELTHPYYAMTASGLSVDIVSIRGGKAPIDERSMDLSDELNKRFLDTPELVEAIENSKSLSDVNSEDYAAIVFAGGHGTMWDFPDSAAVNAKAVEIYERGGVVAAICHGPAALVNLKLSNGKNLIDGRKVAAFTNEEEDIVGLTQVVPFSLEDKLKESGANFVGSPAWSENVVADGRLVTGQNPQSAEGVGKKVSELLKK